MRKLTWLHLGVAAALLSLNFANAGGWGKGGGGGGGLFGGGGFFHRKAFCEPAYYAGPAPGPTTCFEPQVAQGQLYIVEGVPSCGQTYIASAQTCVGRPINGAYGGSYRVTRAQLDPRIPHYYNGQLIPLTAEGYVISWPGEENIPWIGDLQHQQPAVHTNNPAVTTPPTNPANPPPPPVVQPETVTPPPPPGTAPPATGERLSPRNRNQGVPTPGRMQRRTNSGS